MMFRGAVHPPAWTVSSYGSQYQQEMLVLHSLVLIELNYGRQ